LSRCSACEPSASSDDPCTGVTCSFYGICISDGIAPYCSCERGFHPIDRACAPNDPDNPCDGVDCNAHGNCRVEAGFPVCDCYDGYARDRSGMLCLEGIVGADADADADGDVDVPPDADTDVSPEVEAEADTAEDIEADADPDDVSDGAGPDGAEDGSTEDGAVVDAGSGSLRLLATVPRNPGTPNDGFGLCGGDVDNDGRGELVLLHVSGAVEITEHPEGTPEVSFTLPAQAASCVVADTDGDTTNELVVGTTTGDPGGNVYVGSVSGGTWTERWRSPGVASFRFATHLAVGDVNGNGRPDIIAPVAWYGRRIEIWESDGAGGFTSILSTGLGSDGTCAALGDFDGDGDREFVVGLACWGGYGVRVYDGLASIWSVGGLGQTRVSALDVDEDGLDELLVGTGSTCGGSGTEAPTLNVYEFAAGPTFSLVAASPTLADFAAGSQRVSLVHGGNLAGDEQNEIFICAGRIQGTGFECYLYRLDAAVLARLWTWAAPADDHLQQVLVYDPAGDGIPQAFAAGYKNLYVFEPE
jgi:hypothetical protein